MATNGKKLEKQGKTVVVILVDNKLLGIIAMQDTLRSDAFDAVNKLGKLGIKTVMLTGITHWQLNQLPKKLV